LISDSETEKMDSVSLQGTETKTQESESFQETTSTVQLRNRNAWRCAQRSQVLLLVKLSRIKEIEVAMLTPEKSQEVMVEETIHVGSREKRNQPEEATISQLAPRSTSRAPMLVSPLITETIHIQPLMLGAMDRSLLIPTEVSTNGGKSNSTKDT